MKNLSSFFLLYFAFFLTFSLQAESPSMLEEETTVTLGECRGCDSEISVTFIGCDDCIDITSCKDLSNVVLLLADSSHYKFDNLNVGNTATFCSVDGQDILGAWVKAGCKKSGDGPGYGRFFDGPCTGGVNNYGDITGGVTNDVTSFGLIGVIINLYADDDVDGLEDGAIINSDTTDANGDFSFIDVAIGDYVLVQEQPLGYITVSEEDITSGIAFDDVDNAPDISTTDNRIPVTVETDEEDADNNFIEEEDFPGLPGELVLTYDLDPFFVDEVTDVVTYTYTCRNPGQGDVFDINVEDLDAVNGVNYISGDTNGDNILPGNDGETWVFQSSRTWTWADGDLIVTNAEATAMDGLDNQLQDNKSATCFTIGANMEITCDKQLVSPGETITISLISRMFADPSINDAQWSNIDFKCNIMPDPNWQKAGPNNKYFDDPSGDYINTNPGANPTSIDLLDGADMGDYPDWIHTFTYVVPKDQSTDLVITGCDRGDMRATDASGTWLEGSHLVRFATLIIPLTNQKMVQNHDEDGINEQSWTSTIGGGQIGNDEFVVSTNPSEEELENRINTNASPSIFTLFPNPVSDVLNLSIAKEYIGENAKIELIGTNGQQIVIQQYDELPENVTIQVNSVIEGLYYVRISTEDKISKIFTVIKN